MTKHLAVASMFLGTGALLGCGVVIAELWTRSHQAETRATDLQEELASIRESEQRLRVQAREADQERASLVSARGGVEEERDRSLETTTELRTSLVRLQAQNDELQETAKRAIELSKQVAALKQQLAAGGKTELSARSDRNLVRVKKPQVSTPDKSRTDDAGWKSVAQSR